MNMHHPNLGSRPMFDKPARHSPKSLADGVGFEPTDACTSPVFKTGALNRSATHPRPDANSANAMREKPAAGFQTAFQIISGHFLLIHPISFGGTGCARCAVNEAGPMAALHLSLNQLC